MKPPRFWFEFVADWKSAPMAYWVHVEADGHAWRDASAFDPSAPRKLPRGYPELNVAFNEFVFKFTSTAQLDVCIEVLSKAPLPTTRRLSAQRGTGAGPNGHWLSRLPASIKAPKARQKAVAMLRRVAAAQPFRKHE